LLEVVTLLDEETLVDEDALLEEEIFDTLALDEVTLFWMIAE
jgi:hypothetical protein